MAITYPLSLPTDIGIAEIELRASNVVGISESPFTYKQQVVQHQGQRWEASVSIPAVRKDLMEPWIAFLLKLKGVYGTFLLGDPNMATTLRSRLTVSRFLLQATLKPVTISSLVLVALQPCTRFWMMLTLTAPERLPLRFGLMFVGL
jgi:hypothetical protein